MRWLGFLVLGAGGVGRVFNYPLYQPVNEVAPPWAEPASSQVVVGESGLEWSLGPRLGRGSLGSRGEKEGSQLKLFSWHLPALLDSLRCSQGDRWKGWG